MSGDAGKSFSAQPSLSTDSAGDQALAAGLTGRVYASFVNYFASPSRQQIVDYMSPNICRCGTYVRIVRAIERASQEV